MKQLGPAYTASLSNPPQPGDIIVWRRVDPNNPAATGWYGHIGLVHSFADGNLWTIEGNRGSFPSKVKSFRYSWSLLVSSATNERRQRPRRGSDGGVVVSQERSVPDWPR